VTVADEDLGELVRLIHGADSVELKLSVPESQQRSTIAELGMDPLDAEIRQVYFFDTPGLAPDAAGVVVRARRVQGKGDDSVVKLRPVVPGELPVRLRIAPGFGIEVDAGSRRTNERSSRPMRRSASSSTTSRSSGRSSCSS